MAATAVVTALLVLAGGAAPAHAIGTGGVAGAPGYVVVNVPQTIGTEAQVVISYNPYITAPYSVFSTNGAVAYRSAATNDAQTIRAVYYLQKYGSAGWENLFSSPAFDGVVVGDITGAEFPSWAASPTAQSAGSYRFVYAISWFDSLGQLIGFAEYFPNLPGETQCGTQTIRCVPYAGWIDMG